MSTSVDYLIKVLADTKQAESKLGKFGKGAGIAAATIGAAGIGAAAGLFAIGDTFDKVEDTIRTGTGATGDALDGLVESAQSVGKEVPANFENVGTTVADLNTRLGLTGDSLETVASQVLEASRILGEDVDIAQTSAAFNAFKIEGEDVAGAMDTLFQVSQATGVGLNELAAGAQANAPALQALGFGFEDAISLVGTFDKAGLNSTQIMSSMSRGLVNLAKDGEQPAAAYERVIGELQGFINAGDEASALDLAGQVFGTRGASQFIGALQSGVLNVEDLMAATGATGDTILGVAEETKDFGETWTQMVNNLMVALEPLATAVFDSVGDGLAYVMPYIEQFGAWISENQWAIAALAVVIGVTLVAATVAWTASIWAMNAALLANPITWIILAIVALIAAIVLLVLNWDTVVAWITEVWGGFIDWVWSLTEGFASWWEGVWAGISAFFIGVWESLVNVVTTLWQWHVDWIMGVISGFIGFWQGAWTTVSSVVTGIWNGIVNAVRNAIQWVMDGIGNGLNWISNAWSNMWGGLAGVVRGVFNGVIGAIQSGINGAIGLINGMIGAVNNVSGAVGITIPLIPSVSLPRLAQGGVTSGPTLALIGDNPGGREVVEPLSSYEARLDRAYEAGARSSQPAQQYFTLELHGDAAALEGVFQMFLRKADGSKVRISKMGKQVTA